MKKYPLLFAIPCCVSCTEVMEFNEAGDSQDVGMTEVCIPAEEAFPCVDKDIYITKSGVALAKLDSLYILQGDVVLSPNQVATLEKQQTRGALMTSITSYWDLCWERLAANKT